MERLTNWEWNRNKKRRDWREYMGSINWSVTSWVWIEQFLTRGRRSVGTGTTPPPSPQLAWSSCSITRAGPPSSEQSTASSTDPRHSSYTRLSWWTTSLSLSICTTSWSRRSRSHIIPKWSLWGILRGRGWYEPGTTEHSPPRGMLLSFSMLIVKLDTIGSLHFLLPSMRTEQLWLFLLLMASTGTTSQLILYMPKGLTPEDCLNG